jgi:restriction system protein
MEFARLVEQLVAYGTPPIATFALDALVPSNPITVVSGLVGARLVAYFKEHPEDLRQMDRRKFEELVAAIFDGFGYDVELTQQTRDGGRDIIAVKKQIVEVKYLIECKRPDPGHSVGVRAVRELFGVKNDERATKAILATTTFFTPDALTLFENHKWELEPRDYDGLLDWINADTG